MQISKNIITRLNTWEKTETIFGSIVESFVVLDSVDYRGGQLLATS